ncbi:FliH/SctL family protein [Propionispira raffinosivorans]|uniref:FliH/SctL family protein n=1 Tax=Propionispira raffinosivorans TaxID=86959 RepID=UPI0003753545|nr:FliH/SctL family protein [Propionispira raffinosivorans]
MSRVIKGAVWHEEPRLVKNPAVTHMAAGLEKATDLSTAAQLFVLEEERKAQKVLENAELERNAMIAEAQRHVESLLAQAALEAEEMKQTAQAAGQADGYDKGHNEGYEAAVKEQQGIIETANKKAESTIALAETEKENCVQQAEKQIIELVMAIADKVLPQHFIDAPQLILPMVRSALNKVKDQNNIVIRVSPPNYEFVLMGKNEFQSMLDGQGTLKISSDPALGDSDCIIESANGNVDARLATQLEIVKKSIQEVLQ